MILSPGPDPPETIGSFAVPPLTRSVPLPPERASCPPQPRTASFPPSAQIVSSAAVPVMVSFPAVPAYEPLEGHVIEIVVPAGARPSFFGGGVGPQAGPSSTPAPIPASGVAGAPRFAAIVQIVGTPPLRSDTNASCW